MNLLWMLPSVVADYVVGTIIVLVHMTMASRMERQQAHMHHDAAAW